MMSNLYALILCPISQGEIVIELGKDWRIKKHTNLDLRMFQRSESNLPYFIER